MINQKFISIAFALTFMVQGMFVWGNISLRSPIFIIDNANYSISEIDSLLLLGADGFVLKVDDENSWCTKLKNMGIYNDSAYSNKITVFLDTDWHDSTLLNVLKQKRLVNDSIFEFPAHGENAGCKICRWQSVDSTWDKPLNIINPDSLQLQIQFFEDLFNEWFETGVRPDLVILNGYSSTVDSLKLIIQQEASFLGKIITDKSPLKKVFWNNEERNTGLKFNLPVSRLRNVNTLYAPGFYFSPSKLRINRLELGAENEIFAIPYKQTDNLRLLLDFNYSFRNNWNKKESFENREIFFVKDDVSEIVASFEDESHLKLGRPRKLGLFNNSFTVSMRVCLNPVKDLNNSKVQDNIKERSQNIDSLLRKGLEKRMPIASKIISENRSKKEQGSNVQKILDCVGRKKNDRFRVAISDTSLIVQFSDHQFKSAINIENGKWYNLALRYDKFLKQLDFFIDDILIHSQGAVEPLKFDRPLYLSDIDGKNSFTGYFSQFVLWNRSLSDHELTLHNSGGFTFEQNKAPGKNDKLLLILAALFLLLLYFYFLIRQLIIKQKRKDTLYPEIKLIGEFVIYSSDKTRVSDQMNSTLKQLFLLLFFYSYHRTKGLSTEELSEFLWPGLKESEARNKRGASVKELREIIDEIGATISYKDKKWKIKLSEDTYCDYLEILKIISRYKIVKSGSIMKICKEESLLPGIEYPWIAIFQEETKSKLLEILFSDLRRLKKTKKKDFLVRDISQQILCFDPTNDEVVATKIKWHLMHGQITEAEETYSIYCKAFIATDRSESPTNYQSFIL